jgi:hypothetical protein
MVGEPRLSGGACPFPESDNNFNGSELYLLPQALTGLDRGSLPVSQREASRRRTINQRPS